MLTNIYAGILWWPRTKFFSILMELKKSIFSSWLVSWPNGISTSTQERMSYGLLLVSGRGRCPLIERLSCRSRSGNSTTRTPHIITIIPDYTHHAKKRLLFLWPHQNHVQNVRESSVLNLLGWPFLRRHLRRRAKRLNLFFVFVDVHSSKNFSRIICRFVMGI